MSDKEVRKIEIGGSKDAPLIIMRCEIIAPARTIILEHIHAFEINISACALLELQDCLVGSLRFRASKPPTDAWIERCDIAEIEFRGNSAGFVSMSSCVIGTLECGATQPFGEDVIFHDVVFAGMPEDSAHIQSFRNVRRHLAELDNIQAESAVHAKLLRMERKHETGFNRLVSALYDLASEYGSSTFRPMLWLILLTCFFTLLIFATGSAATLNDENLYVGW